MLMRWYRQWEISQALIILPIIVVLAGIAGLILGSGAARSLGNLGGSLVVRITAFFLLAGGLTVLIGMMRHHFVAIALGSAVASFGAALYGTGTLFGFGTGGIMSGLFAIGIALVFFERVIFALNRARVQRTINGAHRSIENDQAGNLT